MLGYITVYPARPLALAQTANTYFNFAGSSKLIVQLTNMPNDYQGSDGVASFSLPLSGISSFGAQYLYDSQTVQSYSHVDFATTQAISNLGIRLLDADYQPLETVNGDNSNMNITMTLVAYTSV